MSLADLKAALKALEGNDAPQYDQIMEFIKIARETRSQLPELVNKYGSYALARFSSRMPPTELWSLREDVAIASLEVGKNDEAWPLVDLIHRHFPDSVRATRLLGMHFEATKDFAKAEELYATQLEKDPQNPAILRRMVAVREGQADLVGAVELLRSYLSTYATDSLGWEHAASLYLRLGSHPQAIFCLEEVLLHQPGNVNVMLLVGDALYALGGTVNWEAARGYYSGVVEISGGANTRALYGVCACAAQLAAPRPRGSAAAAGDGSGIGGLAGEALRQQYALKNGDKLPLVDAMLKAQGLLHATGIVSNRK